jgi:NADPH:quinone reductase-like Zn-dependent oxidoreductase
MPLVLPSAAVPVAQPAVVQDSLGLPTISDSVPVPDLTPGTILVKVAAVALNPVDFKMGVAFPIPGATIGMDYVGQVIRVADENMEHAHVRIGDTVCGAVHGSNPAEPDNGAFTNYVRAPSDLIFRVPHGFPLESAASLGIPLLTSGMAVWDSLGLTAWPDSPAEVPSPVLVYGGSTACGTMAIQLLKLWVLKWGVDMVDIKDDRCLTP